MDLIPLSPVGTVYLVGAGPGDPGLLTLRGHGCLQRADTIIYDALANSAILDFAPPSAERIFAGKRGHRPGMRQEEINRLLIDHARRGRQVVRLKGGDPFVFGRGAEEALALRNASIPFEVVPGVSAAIAVPAYAGIPVTHRGLSSSFTVVTGHEDLTKSSSEVDWSKLATATGTLVLMMGAQNIGVLANALVQHGRPPQTPVAVVRWGTYPEQQTWQGTLANIESVLAGQPPLPPLVIVVGDVVRLREKIRWFDTGPLFGKRVLVTRTREQASTLVQALAAERAIPIELPVISIKKSSPEVLDAALDLLRLTTWAVFTSSNSVRVVIEHAHGNGHASLLDKVRIAAVGPATARAIHEAGYRVAFVPSVYTGAILGEELTDVRDNDVVLLQAAAARPNLRDILSRRGARVHTAVVYATVADRTPSPTLDAVRRGEVDIVTFTSSSTVERLLDALHDNGNQNPVELLRQKIIACIGPVTAANARAHGLPVHVMSDEHSVPGLVAALRTYYTAQEHEHAT